MSILFMDGFEKYSTADKWKTAVFTRIISEDAFLICPHGRFRITPDYTFFQCGPLGQHEPPISEAEPSRSDDE